MNTSSEWWERFFHGPWGRWQLAGIWQRGRAASEADFIERVLGLDAGDQILDVACGTGRHAVELAERGYEVTGIDFNDAALAVAREAAAGIEPAPCFIKRDMRCLPFREQFDAAYCFWTSFGYFEDSSHDLVAAKRIAEALRPGGRLLLDLHTTETILPIFKDEGHEKLDDGVVREIHERRELDIAAGRINAEWTFTEAGRSEQAFSSVRLYSYYELCALLGEAGFERFEAYDTLTGEPFALGATRLGLVASLR